MRRDRDTHGRTRKRPVVRAGRPPRERAGEVDGRILDAAQRVFLERGLGGASVDEIARLARAGKPTIYARFPSKEALFTAVAMRNAANVRAQFENYRPAGATIEERLASVGTAILNGLLSAHTIDFMRLAIAESRRFPELAKVGRMARERGAQAAMRVLGEVAKSDEIGACPAFEEESVEATTQFFMDLVVGRLLMRAIFGEELKLLRGEIGSHVTQSVHFFLAACQHDHTE